MKKLVLIPALLLLPHCFAGTTADTFSTCYSCTQIHELICPVTPVKTQCGSEDWTGGSYVGCRNFYLNTYNCSGVFKKNTTQEDKPTMFCIEDPSPLGAACQI